MKQHTRIRHSRKLLLTIALLTNFVAPSFGQFYTVGSINGQNGWSTFGLVSPDNSAITTADARTGLQSWRSFDGGGKLSPALSQTAIGNSSINTFTTSFWFKQVGTLGDHSRLTIDFGGDHFILRTDGSVPMVLIRDPAAVTLYRNISIDSELGYSWNHLAITKTALPGLNDDIIQVSLNGALVTTQGSLAENSGVNGLRFTPSPAAIPEIGFFGFGLGFYFDDITYSTFNSANPSGTMETFSTSFEAVPEPGTMMLFGVACVGFTTLRRRRVSALS